MGIEHAAILKILFALSLFASVPWLFAVGKLVGRALVLYFHPVTEVTLEIEDENGEVETRTIKVSNSSDLAQNLLKAKRIVGHD
ncbi:hypothetical protein OPW13_12445 [Vibrio europaeus]|uniref:Uncharacterized protein n=1 Tax=Vibrio europaeus TaxID=300876 RepID=A0A178J9H3_9VIBR|nr:hypothetical protein [Vibrio europaeus]MDC5704667.1 hypothetical protein [Vibrio europaeus]MDC5711581.1 hypothetical protein [Vibrio europaeus]MDC5713496.1 hypothetical protein [Vibrio europaeus]MDC5843395.1 hypothetical protein [Vibrio europaeus]MDC5860042.1 hypothetical protein [Vibrio europaeus]